MFVFRREDSSLLWAWEEVHDVNDTFLIDVASLENGGRRKVLLLGGARRGLGGCYAKVAPFILVYAPAEHRGRIKVRPKHDRFSLRSDYLRPDFISRMNQTPFTELG